MLYAGYRLSHILCPTTLIAASHRSSESHFATRNRDLDFRCIDHPVIAETIGNVLSDPVVGTSIAFRSPPAMGRLFIASEPRRNSIGRPLHETTIVVILLKVVAAVSRPVSFVRRARPVVLGVLALAVTTVTAAPACAISAGTRTTISESTKPPALILAKQRLVCAQCSFAPKCLELAGAAFTRGLPRGRLHLAPHKSKASGVRLSPKPER
jgi:hypothetical protein